MTIIGIDPGASGGIAWHDGIDQHVLSMPSTRRELIDLFASIVFPEGCDPSTAAMGCVAFIERISGFIPDGGASQMFEFGKSVERVGCILETLGVRIVEVGPKDWQKALHIGSKESIQIPKPSRLISRKEQAEWKEANHELVMSARAANARLKSEWKTKLKSEAERRFPSLKVTLKTSDALLILDYGKQSQVQR